MSIRVEIIADSVDELYQQLSDMARKIGAVVSCNAVDTPNTVGQSEGASDGEAAATPAKRGRGRPPKAKPEDVAEAPAEAPSEAPAEEPDTTETPAPPPPAEPTPEEDLKATVDALTAIATKHAPARERIAVWRDERGMKWLRELKVDHLVDAKALLTELSASYA